MAAFLEVKGYIYIIYSLGCSARYQFWKFMTHWNYLGVMFLSLSGEGQGYSSLILYTVTGTRDKQYKMSSPTTRLIICREENSYRRLTRRRARLTVYVNQATYKYDSIAKNGEAIPLNFCSQFHHLAPVLPFAHTSRSIHKQSYKYIFQKFEAVSWCGSSWYDRDVFPYIFATV